MNNKMIGVSFDIHKRIKILSAKTEKKIYVLIEEALIWLEEKYNNDNQ